MIARAQVVAMVVASHPRCGALSPLRCVMDACLSSQLWELCCAGPGAETHFCIMVTSERTGHMLTLLCGRPEDRSCEDDHLLRGLSVSTLTGGVIRAPSAADEWSFCSSRNIHKYGLVSSDLLVMTSPGPLGMPAGIRRFSVVDREGNERRWLMNGPCDSSFVSAARKWWVHVRTNSLAMTVVCLLDVHQQKHAVEDSPVEVNVTPPQRTVMGSVGDWWYLSLFFSRSNPDEATVLFQSRSSRRSLLFVVIDIKRTHETRSLAVVDSSVGILPFEGRVLEVLSFRCPRTNQPTFIVETRSSGFSLFVFAISNGNVTQLTEAQSGLVSQLNESQFCVTQRDVYEVWDCKDLTQPTRSLPHVVPGHLAMLKADSGFIFHTSNQAVKITVTGPFNETVVSLSFTEECSNFHVFNTV
ncbi:hypothetical protein Pelo_7495 [Pelomyxa schiedti]|nr:hypothetical protein Pelo_7495 [Pelomyxa schiedti]